MLLIFLDEGNLLLASSAQDNYIRIWCICSANDMIQDTRAMEKAFSVSSEKDTKHYTIHLETVLCGHDGWVYEVRWHPKILNEGKKHDLLFFCLKQKFI